MREEDFSLSKEAYNELKMQRNEMNEIVKSAELTEFFGVSFGSKEAAGLPLKKGYTANIYHFEPKKRFMAIDRYGVMMDPMDSFIYCIYAITWKKHYSSQREMKALFEDVVQVIGLKYEKLGKGIRREKNIHNWRYDYQLKGSSIVIELWLDDDINWNLSVSAYNDKLYEKAKKLKSFEKLSELVKEADAL